MKSVEIYVSGRVQGVGFRYFVVRKANLYNIKGYTRNLYDGRVQVVACAEETDLEMFIKELRKGSTFSRIKKLEISDLTTAVEYDNFRVEF